MSRMCDVPIIFMNENRILHSFRYFWIVKKREREGRGKNFSITQACNFSFLKNICASLDSRDTQLRYTESRVTSRLGRIPGRLGNRLPRIATRRVGATRRTCANLSLSFPPPSPLPLSVSFESEFKMATLREPARRVRTHARVLRGRR